MTRSERWAYISGFMDGEGCIIVPLGHNSTCPVIKIVQAGPIGLQVLTIIKDFLNEEGFNNPRIVIAKRKPPRKIAYELIVSTHVESVRMMQAMLPYLIVKRHTAQDVLRFLKIYPSLNRVWRNNKGPENLVCSKGHILCTDNVGFIGGKKYCKPCRREYMREYRQLEVTS